MENYEKPMKKWNRNCIHFANPAEAHVDNWPGIRRQNCFHPPKKALNWKFGGPSVSQGVFKEVKSDQKEVTGR